MFLWPGDNASSRGKELSRQWIGASRLLAVGWRVWVGPLVLLVFIVLAGWLSLSRHATFHTHVFDLGYYAQVIWNTGHGRWFATSLKPPTFLGDHFSPLLAILAPLFWTTTDASTLLIVEIIALSLAIIPGYLVLRQRHAILAPFLVLGFVLNPALHTLALQEFHEIMLAIPLLSLAMYALYVRKMPLLYVALALTLLVREDMGLYVALFGVYMLFWVAEYRRQGIVILVAGLVWFAAMVCIVIPALGNGHYPHARHLIGGEGTPIEAIVDTVRHPLRVLGSLADAPRGEGLLRLLVPVAGIPLLAAGEQLLWGLPVFGMLLSSDKVIGTLSGWYLAPILPLLWSSIGRSIARQQERLAFLGMVLLLACSIIGFVLWSPFPGGGRFQPAEYVINEHVHIGHRIISAIPDETPLAVQNGLGAHVAAREKLFLFPWFDLSQPPEMILLDMKNADTYPLDSAELESTIRHMQTDLAVQTRWEQDGYYLFEVDREKDFPAQGPFAWSCGLVLEGFELAQSDELKGFVSTDIAERPDHDLRIMLYWTARCSMDEDYSISVRLVTPDGFVCAQSDSRPARELLNTLSWPAGKTIRDTHYVQWPATVPVDTPVDLVVIVYETESVQPVAPQEGHVLMSWIDQ